MMLKAWHTYFWTVSPILLSSTSEAPTGWMGSTDAQPLSELLRDLSTSASVVPSALVPLDFPMLVLPDILSWTRIYNSYGSLLPLCLVGCPTAACLESHRTLASLFSTAFDDGCHQDLGLCCPCATQMILYINQATWSCLSVSTITACILHPAALCWIVSGAALHSLGLRSWIVALTLNNPCPPSFIGGESVVVMDFGWRVFPISFCACLLLQDICIQAIAWSLFLPFNWLVSTCLSFWLYLTVADLFAYSSCSHWPVGFPGMCSFCTISAIVPPPFSPDELACLCSHSTLLIQSE